MAQFEQLHQLSFVPRVPRALAPRHDLIARLDEAARNPLVIVRAQSGGGKTSLLASWANRHAPRGVWISLDASTGDRTSFWKRVVDALDEAGLVSSDSVLADVVPADFLGDALRRSLVKGFQSFGGPVTIVLDDYHEVDDPAVDDDLHQVLRESASVHVLIGTRVLSSLERPDRMAQVDTAVLTTEDLVLSIEDVADAAEAAGIVDDVAADVHRAFGGWPLPSRAALVELASGRADDIDQAIERVRATDMAVALDDDVASSEYVRFLLRSSIAHRLTPALAEEWGASAEFLPRAERQGLGTWTSAASDTDFVYHAYIRARLEAALIERMPEEVNSLRADYARDRLTNGDPVEAVRQYLVIGDFGSVVDVVRMHYGRLQWVLRSDVIPLLRQGDQAELRKHPELLALMMLSGSADQSLPRLGVTRLASLVISVAQARLGSRDPVERLTLLLTLLAGQRLTGHYDLALKTAQRVVEIASVLDDSDRARVLGLLPSALNQAATSLLYDGQLDRAQDLYRTALDAATQARLPWHELHSASMRLVVPALQGDIARLRAPLAAARTRTRPHAWRGTYASAGEHLAEAIEALERFDSVTARETLAELAPHEATIEHWPMITSLRSVAAAVDGAYARGVEEIDADIASHAERPATSRYMQEMLSLSRVDLLIGGAQLPRAAHALRPARFIGGQVVHARLELALGHPDRAIAFAARATRSDEHLPRVKAEAHLVMGVAALRLDQGDSAGDSVERALELMSNYGLRRPFITVPRRDLEIVLAALGQDPASVLEGVPDVGARPVSAWGLTDGELRVLEGLRDTGSADEIAATLHVSANTVKSHLRQVYRKLGVRSRQEALGVAHLHGLLEHDE